MGSKMRQIHKRNRWALDREMQELLEIAEFIRTAQPQQVEAWCANALRLETDPYAYAAGLALNVLPLAVTPRQRKVAHTALGAYLIERPELLAKVHSEALAHAEAKHGMAEPSATLVLTGDLLP